MSLKVRKLLKKGDGSKYNPYNIGVWSNSLSFVPYN
jgi:hypothetical protein